jgi:hypothetical protein
MANEAAGVGSTHRGVKNLTQVGPKVFSGGGQ